MSIKVKIGDRYVRVADQRAAEILEARIKHRQNLGKVIRRQMKDAKVGPRSGPGSQFSGWVDTKTDQTHKPDTELVYTTEGRL